MKCLLIIVLTLIKGIMLFGQAGLVPSSEKVDITQTPYLPRADFFRLWYNKTTKVLELIDRNENRTEVMIRDNYKFNEYKEVVVNGFADVTHTFGTKLVSVKVYPPNGLTNFELPYSYESLNDSTVRIYQPIYDLENKPLNVTVGVVISNLFN